MECVKVGFAMTGSFCTFSKAISQMKLLKEKGYDVLPIMSNTAYKTDTRFGNAEKFVKDIEEITGKKVLHTIVDVEPIGPKKMLDILVVAPCTGNTLAKLSNGMADSSVTLCAKAHLRNNRPVLLSVSTNDALSTAAKNIGFLLNNKNYYFVPMRQDDHENKPNSIVADFKMLESSIQSALKGKQIQPMIF